MKKIFLLGASLILVGAGCSNTTPNSNPGAVNTPAAPTAVQPTVDQAAVVEAIKNNPTVPPPATSQPVDATPSFTMAEVAVNNSPSKCWSTINNNVYDLTAYAPKHPGGKEQVYAICGKDGKALFDGQHSMSQKAKDMLNKLKVGVLK